MKVQALKVACFHGQDSPQRASGRPDPFGGARLAENFRFQIDGGEPDQIRASFPSLAVA